MSVLSYDPDTGLFTRKIGWHRFSAGSIAGALHPNGYVYISINGTRTGAHRLAWLYVEGTLPDCSIDHLNGVRSDNRIANLREASVTLNAENQRRPHSNNKSGFLGVSRNTQGSWSARIRVKGKLIQIGSFPDPEAAHSAYLNAKRLLHEGCSI